MNLTNLSRPDGMTDRESESHRNLIFRESVRLFLGQDKRRLVAQTSTTHILDQGDSLMERLLVRIPQDPVKYGLLGSA